MSREMSLRMKIEAEGRQAMGELRRVSRGVQDMAQRTAAAGRGAREVFDVAGRGIGVITAPLRHGGRAAGVLGAGFAALSGYSLTAAGDLDMLRHRLEFLTSSKEEADRVFRHALEMGIASPFSPDELVETQIQLRAIGVEGRDALQAVADAATVMGTKPLQMVNNMAMLSTRTLRQMGVEMTREGERFEFSFQDRMGAARRIAAESAEDARKALADIFSMRFGSAMEGSGDIWGPMISTLRGLMRTTAGQFGDGLKVSVHPFIHELTEGLDGLRDSGRVEEIGRKIGDHMADAIDIGRQLIRDPESIRQVLGGIMEFSARAFIEYLSVGKDVLLSLARMMAAAFVGAVIDSGLPGTGMVRSHMIRRMVPQPEAPPLFGTREQYDRHQNEVDEMYRRRRELEESPELFRYELTRRHSAQFAESAAAVPARFAQAGRNLEGIWQDTMAPVLPRSRLFHGSGDEWVDRFDRGMHQDSLAGTGSGGGQAAPIVIHNLTVRGNEVREIQNKILRQAAAPRLSAAGGY